METPFFMQNSIACLTMEIWFLVTGYQSGGPFLVNSPLANGEALIKLISFCFAVGINSNNKLVFLIILSVLQYLHHKFL